MKHIIGLLFFLITFNNLFAQDELPLRISIEEAEKIAIKHNITLKKGLNRIESAEGRYLSGVSPQMPELSLSYDFVPNGSSLGNYEERSLEINQGIEFPLKTIYRGNRLNNDIDIINAENSAGLLSVLSEVRKAYIILLEKQSLIKIAEENRSVSEEFKNKSGIRFNVGEATNLEKLTAEVQYAQSVNNLEVLKNQYKAALSDLLLSFGIKGIRDDYNPVLTDSLMYIPYSENLEKVIQQAMNLNPSLLLSELKKSNTQMGKKIAITSYLPDFIIGYKSQSINGVNDYYGINFGISLPLWFLFDQKGRVKEADAEIKISEYEYDETRLSVAASTKKAYINLKNSEKQISLFQNTLNPESEEIFRVANASYQIGDITYLEFLQAKQTMITTKEGFINALKEYNLNLIELEKAIGKKLYKN